MQKPWGYSLAIDIKNCDPATIRSKEKIQDFIIKLCKEIDMVRFGDCQIVHFGTGNKEGYSVVQLIETSCITAHFANDTESAYIDIFSCKEFNFAQTIEFAMEFFGGSEVTSHSALRF